MTAQARNVVNEMTSVLSFLTILPIPHSSPAGASLHGAARGMYLFPVAGAVIGLVMGLLAWGLFEAVDPLLAGLAVAAAILAITGLHHTDGLSDLADGLMAGGGSYDKKLEAMRDKVTGTAGTAAIVLCVAGMVIVLSRMNEFAALQIVVGILLSEMLAKFSMVVMAAAAGHAASGSGSGALFVQAMKDRRKLMVAALITVPVVVILGGVVAGMIMLAASVLVPAILICVAGRSFGGITGDVIGASNEMVRLATLAVFVSV